MLVKIHESYRKIVAVCDSDLLGKRIEEGKMQLDISRDFFGGDKKSEKEVIEIIKDACLDDATFNFVGKKSVGIALKIGLLDKEGIISIQGVPCALTLL